jgi:hypothetical protein
MYASTCSSDWDCPTFQTCEVEQNWKQCRINWTPGFCNTDADCALSEYCDGIVAGYGTCRSRNECEADNECPTDFICQSNGTYNVCVFGHVCTKHSDCPVGYRCVAAVPKNYCEYANECSKDSDCSATQACVVDGNWTRCQTSWNGVCNNDGDCDASEWCDLTIGPIGVCRSRHQCLVDPDCGEGMACQDNGQFRECVPLEPTNCWFDFQCPDNWTCYEGKCKPFYEGTCTNVEGRWTVLLSSCLTVPIGTTYEFIPENGCNGIVKLGLTNTNVGSFTETAAAQYNVTLALLYNCQASVTLSALMTMNCPLGCDGVQLVRH